MTLTTNASDKSLTSLEAATRISQASLLTHPNFILNIPFTSDETEKTCPSLTVPVTFDSCEESLCTSQQSFIATKNLFEGT